MYFKKLYVYDTSIRQKYFEGQKAQLDKPCVEEKINHEM